jgi:hypothetical protein
MYTYIINNILFNKLANKWANEPSDLNFQPWINEQYKCIITSVHSDTDIATTAKLEFENEKDYIWFVLKYG